MEISSAKEAQPDRTKIETQAGQTRPDGLSEKDIQKLEQAAQDFEAIFIAQLLRGMRRSIPQSGIFGKGLSADIYSGMFDQEIAKAIAGKGALPLSDILITSLTQKQESGMTGLTLADYKLRAIRKASRPTVSYNWDRAIIAEAAEEFKLDAKLLHAIIKVESGYKADAVSRKGAVGLMQLMKNTATSMGVRNRFDPRQNVFGGAKYLRMLLDRFNGDLVLALSAYNAGPQAVEKYREIPPYKETQRYVHKVLLNYREM